jgi:hypothetical protein
VANYLVLTKVDADLALSAEQSTAQGNSVLPIFIPQGWPQAMSHLLGFCPAPYPHDPTCNLHQDAPLETVTDRWVPRHVDQTWTRPGQLGGP